jgi:hypothetical protein
MLPGMHVAGLVETAQCYTKEKDGLKLKNQDKVMGDKMVSQQITNFVKYNRQKYDYHLKQPTWNPLSESCSSKRRCRFFSDHFEESLGRLCDCAVLVGEVIVPCEHLRAVLGAESLSGSAVHLLGIQYPRRLDARSQLANQWTFPKSLFQAS